ncbi:MAG: hypothetical protein U1E65_17290 [Myxococcota bacterium]
MRTQFFIPIVSALALACSDPSPVAPTPEPVDAGCNLTEEPRHYEVFFVLDVSGSMAPFLRDVRAELEGLALGFPEIDHSGHSVRIDYYVVAFVNDYKVFGGGRMSSLLAIQAAFDDAIAAGATERNLNTDTANVEPEENLLDAMAEVPTLTTSQDSVKVVMVATDAEFVEAPSILNQGIQVQNTLSGIRDKMTAFNARVHVFTRTNIPGLDIPLHGVDPLSALPGGSVNRLDELAGARDRVHARLNEIARAAACQ